MIGLRALLVLRILCSVWGRVIVEKNVRGWVGSDVILKCTVKLSEEAVTEEKVTQVTWRRRENGQDVDFLTFGEENKLRKLTSFATSKVDFLGNEHTDGSIRIRDVSLDDESVYTCIFTIYPLGTFQNTTTITVQAKPDVRVEPPPDPAVAKLPYQTVAICVAGAAKPAANITWWTDGLDYNSSESEFQNSNGTVTTESRLRMVPGAGIKDRSVTCIISQGLALPQTEKKLNIQNVQYSPDSVRVEVRTLDNGAVQFICLEDSSPPATNFTWRRKDTFDSGVTLELGNKKTLSNKNFPNGLYICEVTNPIGKSSGSLYFYRVSGGNALNRWILENLKSSDNLCFSPLISTSKMCLLYRLALLLAQLRFFTVPALRLIQVAPNQHSFHDGTKLSDVHVL
ncbi:nectin-1-like isoform X1 [Rana temporaria]|uniref:nectin-1-like isoform X1 n=1 Tax=Rana temporaria TaxID=8407 RepID=UPI001AACBF2B|nr:nectin-1-like isoform X1 [Rana temporaria]